MKRDMGLIRELLMRLEALDKAPHTRVHIHSADDELSFDGYTGEQVDYHMGLLYEFDLITSTDTQNRLLSGQWIFDQLTWDGHDFLETVRDPEVWKKTKSGASVVGGLAFGAFKDMATAYAKHLAKEKLGLDF